MALPWAWPFCVGGSEGQEQCGTTSLHSRQLSYILMWKNLTGTVGPGPQSLRRWLVQAPSIAGTPDQTTGFSSGEILLIVRVCVWV